MHALETQLCGSVEKFLRSFYRAVIVQIGYTSLAQTRANGMGMVSPTGLLSPLGASPFAPSGFLSKVRLSGMLLYTQNA